MPTKQQQQTTNRRLAPLDTSSISTSYTDLSSPAISSRILYHETLGLQRPTTSKSLPPPEEEIRQFSGSSGSGGNGGSGTLPYPPRSSHHRTNSADNMTIESNNNSWHFGRNLNSSNNQRIGTTMTAQEEFDALPIAVRRKFFSTLERLRFAQAGSITAPISHTKNEPHHYSQKGDRPTTHTSSSLAERRGAGRRVSILNTGRRSTSISHNNQPKLKQLRKSIYYPDQSLPDSPDSPRTWFMALPEKIQQSQFSREEQIALAGRLKEGRGARGRESVILDAADEAVWKASHHRQYPRARRNEPEQLKGSPLPESLRSSMDSISAMEKMEEMIKESGLDKETSVIENFNTYDSFRWLDEESDLDLTLNNHLDKEIGRHLDDYHANLTETIVSPLSKTRPSFRRHLSISKIPFSGNLNTRDSSSTPTSPIQPHWAAPPSKGHEAKKSRAISLLPSVRQQTLTAESTGGHDDSNATYWQDPDARLKLRVYLASPQKFDEAIEFGFPSLDTPLHDNKENRPPLSAQGSRFRHGGGGSHGTATSFLNDDDELIFGSEDDASMIDPDSPRTPHEMVDTYNLSRHSSQPNSHMRFASKASSSQSGSARASRERSYEERDYSHLGIMKPTFHKRSDTDGFLGLSSREGRQGMNYMHSALGPGNREMTLRMTLTRPDLRTDVPPPVPEKDRPSEKMAVNFINHRGGNTSVDKLGISTGSLGWQNAATHTTVTVGKPSFAEEREWDEKNPGVRGPFGGHDGWCFEKGEGGGAVKRFWKRVKNSPKRI